MLVGATGSVLGADQKAASHIQEKLIEQKSFVKHFIFPHVHQYCELRATCFFVIDLFFSNAYNHIMKGVIELKSLYLKG